MKIHAEIFFLYEFWKSCVYYVEKEGVCGSTSSAPRDLNFLLVVLLDPLMGGLFDLNTPYFGTVVSPLISINPSMSIMFSIRFCTSPAGARESWYHTSARHSQDVFVIIEMAIILVEPPRNCFAIIRFILDLTMAVFYRVSPAPGWRSTLPLQESRNFVNLQIFSSVVMESELLYL